MGLSPTLPWDDAYRSFVLRLARKIAGAWSEARLRELVVAEAENRYHDLFNQAMDGIFYGRPSGELLAANPAACRILGYSETELLGMRRQILIDPDDPRTVAAVEQRRRTGEFLGELEFLHKSGRRIPCEVSSRIYRDVFGEERTIGVFRDVSERQALERRLRDAQKMEAVGRIAGGIAHDFNNLLTVIHAQAGFLREHAGQDPRTLEDLEVLEGAARRAGSLVRRLLDFSRRSQDTPALIDPARAVRELAPLLQRMLGPVCELVFDVAEPMPSIRMAPAAFEQVVMNLVVNARDAVDEAGRAGSVHVAVRPETDGSGVRLEVTDNGVGIAEKDRSAIFEGLFTTKAHGTGIGLSTVHLLVEQAGGSVELESVPGQGSTFTVRLPAVEDAQGAAGGATEAPATSRTDAATPASVLVVDDQPSIRWGLRKALERAGYRVETAANGDEAVTVARAFRPDLLVTDVVMPLMSGPQLVRVLREGHPELRVLLISGFTGDEVLPAEGLGGLRFLAKPFDLDTFLRAVREVLDA